MLADFEITINGNRHEDQPRTVRVVVYDNVKALRSAASRHANITLKGRVDNSGLLGVCHRFELMNTHLCAIVRLAPPNIGVGMVSHELAHAAVWIRELEEGDELPLTCANDERFCWILGELVRCTINKFDEHKVYDN